MVVCFSTYSHRKRTFCAAQGAVAVRKALAKILKKSLVCSQASDAECKNWQERLSYYGLGNKAKMPEVSRVIFTDARSTQTIGYTDVGFIYIS